MADSSSENPVKHDSINRILFSVSLCENKTQSNQFKSNDCDSVLEILPLKCKVLSRKLF